MVTDSRTGEPLAGVDVFLNKSTVATITDDAGHFELEHPLTGFQELVLFKAGYDLYRSSMKIQHGKSYQLSLTLSAISKLRTSRLTVSEVSSLKEILGVGKHSELLIDKALVKSESKGQQLLGTRQPLIINNDSTGYQLSVYAVGLPLADISRAPIRYIPLAATDLAQTIKWEKGRLASFRGSQRHWLMALLSNQLERQGYTVFNESGMEIDAQSVVTNSSLEGYSKVSFNQALQITYKGESSAHSSYVPAIGTLDVSSIGVPINPTALTVEGGMANILPVSQVPIDYLPLAGDIEDTYAQTLEGLFEKVYVHTDKPYYYPGEPMWFKGYIHYKEPRWRDSLSRVMYVELINPKKETMLSKSLRIDSGAFYNDFILPDSLPAGTYHLRAYTNLNRNFGDSNLFVKPIPILSGTDRVDASKVQFKVPDSPLLSVRPDKVSYKRRERITVDMLTMDANGRPVGADLSISVSDAVQVVPIEETITILSGYPLTSNDKIVANGLKFPVEYGITLRGRFLNDRGKAEKTILTVLQMNPQVVALSEVDENGIFTAGAFDFYDTASFSMKADKDKDYPFGKVELLPREKVPVKFEATIVDIPLQSTNSQQRIISEYEVPKDVRLLEEVQINAAKIDESTDRVTRPYGKGDYVLSAKDISLGLPNLLYSLPGKVPGLEVDPVSKSIAFTRAKGNSIKFQSGPLVTIDDIPLAGDAGEILSMINPATVESIEFRKRISVLHGSQGVGGVIAIYTKKIGPGGSEVANFHILKAGGYSRARKFIFPNYEDATLDKAQADYRSCIYWNPRIVTRPSEPATVSFFAADLPGRYRIVIEGVLSDGTPLRSESYIEIVE